MNNRQAADRRPGKNIGKLLRVELGVVKFGTTDHQGTAAKQLAVEIGHREWHAVGNQEEVGVLQEGAVGGTKRSCTGHCARAVGSSSPNAFSVDISWGMGRPGVSWMGKLWIREPGHPAWTGRSGLEFPLAWSRRTFSMAASSSKVAASRSMIRIAPRGHSPKQAPRPSQYVSEANLALPFDHLDRALGAGVGALAAAVALILVDFDDFACGHGKVPQGERS